MDASTGLTPLLIDAKREYVGQLTDVLAPYVINHVQALYLASTQANRNAPVLAFQRRLREIQQWNANTIAAHTHEIQSRYSFLADLIAACFVAYVKILSSIKLHQQKPNIRLRLPANDTFVHKVYIHAAREFYANPALVRADRGSKVSLVRTAVEASVRDMLPIEDILKAYLGNTVDSADHTMNPAEMIDDQDQQQLMGGGDMGADFDTAGGQVQMMPFQMAPQMVATQPATLGLPQVALAQAQPLLVQQPVMQPVMQAQQPVMQAQQSVMPQQPMMPQPQTQQVEPAAQQPPLFGAPEEDTAPKQISIGGGSLQAPAAQPQATQQQLQQPQFQQDLFSDAEDDF